MLWTEKHWTHYTGSRERAAETSRSPWLLPLPTAWCHTSSRVTQTPLWSAVVPIALVRDNHRCQILGDTYKNIKLQVSFPQCPGQTHYQHFYAPITTGAHTELAGGTMGFSLELKRPSTQPFSHSSLVKISFKAKIFTCT